MPIVYYTEDVTLPRQFKKRLLNQWIKEVAQTHEKITGHIVYIFCNDEKIIEINKRYLQHDYYTDIITFDYTAENIIAGDLYISLDTVKSNSQKFRTNFFEELYRVMIHGILHLCGIGDMNEDEKAKMIAEENNALQILQTMIDF